MPSKKVTSIKTKNWKAIRDYLMRNEWEITKEYKAFNKGTDYDGYTFKKNGRKIKMNWDNWEEGELKCSIHLIKELEQKLNIKLTSSFNLDE